MKKFLIVLSLFFYMGAAFAGDAANEAGNANRNSTRHEVEDADLTTTSVQIFQEKNRFGLQSDTGEVLVKPVYRKLVRIGDSAWITQRHSRFGLIDKSGNYLVRPRYQFADRIFGRYAKLGNRKDVGLYDETGHAVISPEYSAIETLGRGMFLTRKNYKYGIVNMEGKEILPNIFESIYMPERGKIRVRYERQWYELGEVSREHIEIPEDIIKMDNRDFTITTIVTSPVAASGYSALTATNYILKLFSALSPSYEQTIDDLIYSRGADAVGILMNFSWIPKFPVTYAKNYYNILKAPNTGPLSDIRSVLRNHIK